jgi:hypothetical protein
MKPTAGLSRLDPNCARLTLPIPSTTFRALPTSKRRTISIEPYLAHRETSRSTLHSNLSQVVLRRGQTKTSCSCHERHTARLIPLPAGGPAAIMRASSHLRARSSSRVRLLRPLKLVIRINFLKPHDARARPRVHVTLALGRVIAHSNGSIRLRPI